MHFLSKDIADDLTAYLPPLGNQFYHFTSLLHFIVLSVVISLDLLISATKWVLIRHLYMLQIETWCYHQGEERISIIQSWRQEGHLEINKFAI